MSADAETTTGTRWVDCMQNGEIAIFVLSGRARVRHAPPESIRFPKPARSVPCFNGSPAPERFPASDPAPRHGVDG